MGSKEDNAYDDFDKAIICRFSNKGYYLEYHRSFNPSPVSGLTTGSCLKDGGNHDDEQHGAEIGAHKCHAIYQGDARKTLRSINRPMEHSRTFRNFRSLNNGAQQ